MQLPTIKCFRQKHQPGQHEFYVLNKGKNSGKPLHSPCPNCFVVHCRSEEEYETYYWLCYALWQGHTFRPHLIGSVIEFIRLPEFKKVLETAMKKIQTQQDQFEITLISLQQLNETHQNITAQLELIKQMKKIMVFKLLQ